MTEASAQFVGDIPEHYDQGLGPHIFIDYAHDITRRAKAFNPDCVLELAAGTGIVSKALHSELPEKTRLVVTDLNAPMLEIAKQKFAPAANVEFQPADALDLPFSDNEFDLVVCQFGVMFFPDKQQAFREARRVLRKGGRIILNVWGTMAANPFSQVAYDAGAKFFPDNPPLFYKAPFSYPDAKIVINDMQQAGFADITHETICLEKKVHDWELFARGLIFGNPFIEEINSREGVTPDEVMSAVKAALRGRFGDAPATMPLEAIVFEAGKNDEE